MPITQHITATIAVSGPEPVEIASHGTGGPGSFVSVHIGNALVYLHDQLAAECYYQAWCGENAAGPSLFLSKTPRPMLVGNATADHYPVIAIHAHGSDRTSAMFDPDRRELTIFIGYVRWVVRDHHAYLAHRTAWKKVHEIGRIVLPRSTDHKAARTPVDNTD